MTLRVGIISSYKIRCGIASFTDTIQSLLEDEVSIEILPLDQFVLRHRHPRVEKQGDEAIEAIGRRLKDFDVINLQWEPGLFGVERYQWIGRFNTLCRYMAKAKKRVIITAHTVVSHKLVGARPWQLVPRFLQWRYASSTHKLLRQLDRDVDLTLVAHTPRDQAYFKNVVGLSKVVDHPLSYMRKGWPARARAGAADYRQKLDRRVGAGKTLIGTFGFLSDSKGMEVAIRAMRYLPEDYMLLIYGEVHGDDIKPWQAVNRYVSKLMEESLGDTDELRKSLLATPSRPQDSTAGQETHILQSALRQEMLLRNRSIANRVIFMGAPDDFESALAAGSVDVCVFPYLETGESAPSPFAQAIELGAKVALSRTKTFSDLETYFPRSFHFFEIGNALQLSQLIKDLVASSKTLPEPMFGQNSLKTFYSALCHGERILSPAIAI